MKEIRLNISDKAFAVLHNSIISARLGDNYGPCPQAWKKVLDAVVDGENTVQLHTKEEEKAGGK